FSGRTVKAAAVSSMRRKAGARTARRRRHPRRTSSARRRAGYTEACQPLTPAVFVEAAFLGWTFSTTLRRPWPWAFHCTWRPRPRTASEYSSQSCNLHGIGLQLDPTTGVISGTVASTDPVKLECEILAHNSIGQESKAPLKLELDPFTYGTKALSPFTRTYEVQTALQYTQFSMLCTPTVSWLAIDPGSGRLSVQGSDFKPRFATCTVNGHRQICTPGADLGNGTITPATCMNETDTIELALHAPVEPKSVFLTHRMNPDEQVALVSLTVGEEVPDYALVPALSALEREMSEKPSAFFFDCGNDTAHDETIQTVFYKGHEVFRLDHFNQIAGAPSAGIMEHCDGKEPRCKVSFTCKVYAELQSSKQLVSTTFDVDIWDNMCWAEGEGKYQVVERTSAATTVACRMDCRMKKSCAAYVFGGTCVLLRYKADAAEKTAAGSKVQVKVNDCILSSRCLQLDIPGGSYISGDYCPGHVRDRGFPVFAHEGPIPEASFFIHKVHAGRDVEAVQSCGNNPKWILRRLSPMDVLQDSTDQRAAVVELRGDVLLCITTDLLQSVFFQGDLQFEFKATADALQAPVTSAFVQIKVATCKNPLVEREEYMKLLKIEDDLSDPAAAQEVFRFDDESTGMKDDYSIGVCECPSEEFGESFPVLATTIELIPPGSGNSFVPAPQMLAEGSVSCNFLSLEEVLLGLTSEDCSLIATQSGKLYYWFGEYNGQQACRLYSKCDYLELESNSHGILYGVSYAPSCAIANSQRCWNTVKRAEFRSGYSTQSAAGSIPCRFEEVVRDCDRLIVAGVATITECGSCLYADPMYISERRPLPSMFMPGRGVAVSCDADKYRAMARDGSQLLGRHAMTCVDGRWVDSFQKESMTNFICEKGARVTKIGDKSLTQNRNSGKESEWWEHHFGKIIRNFRGECLAPDHHVSGVSLTARFQNGPNTTNGTCPCEETIKPCSCSLNGAFAWNFSLPGTVETVQVIAKLKLHSGPCFLGLWKMMQAQGVAGNTTHELHLNLDPTAARRTFQLHGLTCQPDSIHIAVPQKAGWGPCRGGTKDGWRFRAVTASPDRTVLEFVGETGGGRCAHALTGVLEPCGSSRGKGFLRQALAKKGLQEAVARWTGDVGDKEYNCGDPGTSCKPFTAALVGHAQRDSNVKNFMDILSSSGPIGHEGRLLTSLGLRSTESSFRPTSRRVEVAIKPEQCRAVTTECKSSPDQKMTDLQLHNVWCQSGEAISTIEFRKCSPQPTQHGFQYAFRCCKIVGLGGCTGDATPWITTELSAAGSLTALTELGMTCHKSEALLGFTLEEKESKAKTQYRYLWECCMIPPHSPLAVTAASVPFPGSFSDFDGVYFPAGKTEGRVKMEASFLYMPGNQSKWELMYNKYKGAWCVTSGAQESCEWAAAVHPLGLGALGSFEVTGLESSEDARGDALKGPEPLVLKQVEVKKFEKPPPIEPPSLSDLEFQAAETGFQAAEINERKVSSFDLANRKAWMPTPPKYAPYCALKDSSRWDSEATMDQDGGQPLGSLKRADAGQFSEEKNWQFVEPLADAQNHPCHPFYYAKSSLDRGAWESSFDMSRLLSFQGIDVKKFLHEPVQRGATFAATKACRKRQSQRNTDHAKNLGFGHLRDLTMGAVSYVTDSICSVIPGAGTLLAPMGLGVELSFDFSDICSGINSLVHETYQQVSSRQMLAREAWKDENDNIDSQFCSFVDNQDMYQTFCNLHCVEDAVVKGNFAVLKSMKGLEKYLIETVHSMLLHYAKQSSEHLAAIQQQINTNSANMMDGLESFLTTYFTQGFDQATTYRNDLSTQITDQLNALKESSDVSIDGVNKLQEDIKTVNDNLQMMADYQGKWFDVLDQKLDRNGKQALLSYNVSVRSDMPKHVASVLTETSKLLAVIHQEPTSEKDAGIQEDMAVPLLRTAVQDVAFHAARAVQSMQKGDTANAAAAASSIAVSLANTHTRLAGTREHVTKTMARRSNALLEPAGELLLAQMGTMKVAMLHQSAFHREQKTIMARAASLQQLSDEMEILAASELLLKFDAHLASAHHSFSRFIAASREYVKSKSTALQMLRDAVTKDRCEQGSPGPVAPLKLLAKTINRMDRDQLAVKRTINDAWSDAVVSLARVADVLVDGGLLMHYLRIASLTVNATVPASAKSVAKALELLQAPLDAALQHEAGGFLLQVKRAFTMSSVLLNAMHDHFVDAPDDDLADIVSSWRKLEATALELDEDLKGNLRRELLMNVLQRKVSEEATSMAARFPAARCKSGEEALWDVDTDGSPLLLREGRVLRCDPSGHLSAGAQKEPLQARSAFSLIGVLRSEPLDLSRL
ncbi:unnamed protein product, partial [Effrenium voratum]